MGRTKWDNFKLITSSSNDPADCHQRGGTCIGLVNNIVGRKTTSREDTKGLGQWSYVKIAGKDQLNIIFATAYKPC
eukprot:5210312-Ditylum_brightwellii.AAC.1